MTMHDGTNSQAGTGDALWEVFRQPPAEARPFLRWWWGEDLRREELARELEALAQAGLGGVEVDTMSGPWMSPEWADSVRFTAEWCRQHGMLMDMSPGLRWPFHGHFVPPEDAAVAVAARHILLDGPATCTFNLEHLAVSSPNDPVQLVAAHLAPAELTDAAQLRDLLPEAWSGDMLIVEVPAGQWLLHAVTLRRVGIRPMRSTGITPDHLSAGAVARFLDYITERLSLAPGDVRAFFSDSIEVHRANWTGDFADEFQRRRGYDVRPYLASVLSPLPEDSLAWAETCRRARYDYWRTVAELFNERFTAQFHAWSHAQSALSRCQTYGFPWLYGMEDGYRIPDIPEGNNWLFSMGDRDSNVHGWPVWNKSASSGGHQAGRRIISVEAMTVVRRMYRETLDLIKAADDFNFITGVNHSVLHGFGQSPPTAPFPGTQPYGTFFNPGNPWWPYLRYWTAYNARLSAVFQAAEPVGQVALLFRAADIWCEHGLERDAFHLEPLWAHQVWRWIQQNGAAADYVTEQMLQEAQCADGYLGFGPMRYAALVVLDAASLAPETVDALERYAGTGGRIAFVGALPERAPGLRDAAARDTRVCTGIARLLRDYPDQVLQRDAPDPAPGLWDRDPEAVFAQLGDGSLTEACLAWTDRLLTALAAPRSVRLARPVPGLYQVEYRHGARRLFFFANTVAGEVTAAVDFPDAGRNLWRWDPETGRRAPFPAGTDGWWRITLPVSGSLLLVAEPGPLRAAAPHPRPIFTQALEITGPWTLHCRPADGTAAFGLDDWILDSFHDHPDERLQRFAGQATYRIEFTWTAGHDQEVELDLGGVPHGVSEVTLNGMPLGIRWYGSHRYPASPALAAGRNNLKVTVTTTLFNRMWDEDCTDSRRPAGLIGPVVLRVAASTWWRPRCCWDAR